MINNPFLLALAIRNLLRAWFSNDPEYKERRDRDARAFQREVIEPFKEGYNNPRPASEKPVLIRKPFKIMLAVLLAVIILSMIVGGITGR